MRNITFFLLLIALPAFIYSQGKKLSIEDASYMNRNLLPESVRGLSWMGSTDYFAFYEDNIMKACKANSDKPFEIFSLDDINRSLSKLEQDSIRRLPSFTWLDDNNGYFVAGNKIYVYNIASNQLREMNDFPGEGQNTDLEKHTYAMAYTIDNNLFISSEGRKVQVTSDTDLGIINGQTVHRNEFGISKGTFWSPQGNYLAFYRKDETMVSDYPLVDVSTRIATPENIKYPMAGMTSHEVTLGIYDVKAEKTHFVKTGEPADQYLTCVSWDPGEQYIYIALLNRDQNHLMMNQYDVLSGTLVKTLFEEKNDK